jgi:hypothetical protein
VACIIATQSTEVPQAGAHPVRQTVGDWSAAEEYEAKTAEIGGFAIDATARCDQRGGEEPSLRWLLGAPNPGEVARRGSVPPARRRKILIKKSISKKH